MARITGWIACGLLEFSAGTLCIAADGSAPEITNAQSLRSWVQAARARRAEIVGIGDSNQAFAGHGWDHGLTRASAERFGLYATALFSAGENNGQGQGLGYLCSILSTACCVPQFQYAGAPEPLHRLMPGDVFMYPMNYVYLAPGHAAGGSANLGLYVSASNPLDVNARLRYEVTHGLFPGDTGTLRLSIRLAQPPYSTLVNGPGIPTGGATVYDWSAASLDLPAGQRGTDLNARFTPWGQDMTGPAIVYTQRIINLDRPRGAAVSTLYARGGQSARDMALGILSSTDEQLTLFFSRVRAAQLNGPGVLVRISTGLNDRNEDQPSLGPGGYSDGSSAEAFADNLLAIVQRLNSVWAINQWDPSELHVLLAVSHPVSDPDDPKLVAYRAAADALAASLPRCAVLHLERLTSSGEMLAQGWYQSGGADRNHLTQPAYEELARRELDAIIHGACLQDLNADGFVGTPDLVILLVGFGGSVPVFTGADLDGDGVVTTADLVLLLQRFGESCPG